MSQYAGTEIAARHFAEQHYDEVFRYCYRHVSSIEDAQDITQETFLRFVRSEANYVDHEKPLAYLFTVARNLCFDFYRAKPAPCVSIDEETADPVNEHTGLELHIFLLRT